MRRHLAVLPLVLIGLIGCSSTDPEPAEPPSVLGDYEGTFDFSVVYSNGVSFTQSCDCSISILSQTGTLYTGNVEFHAPCGGTLPFSGTVEADGTIEAGMGYSLLGQEWIKRVATPLTGTFSGGTISAQTTEEYDNATAGLQATLEIQLTATQQ
jgi:hypothetical protein